MVADVREGVPGEFEAATVAEDEGEGVGWGRGEIDLDEDGGRGTAAVGVEGRDREVMGGAKGGAGLAAGLVGSEELPDLNGSAAVNAGLGQQTKKSDLQDDVNHGVVRIPLINGRRRPFNRLNHPI